MGAPGLDLRNATAGDARVVYLDTANQLALTITNSTEGALTLPAAPGPPADGRPGFACWIGFGDLLARATLTALAAPEGWWTAVTDDPTPTLALAPQADVALPVGASVVVPLGAVTVDGEPRLGQVAIDYAGVPGVADDGVHRSVPVQHAPTAPDRALRLHAAFASAVVWVSTDPTTPLRNTLTLRVSNPSPVEPLVAPGTARGNPVFRLSFVCGSTPGYGALTSAEHAAEVDIGPGRHYADTWRVEGHAEAAVPFWLLRPQDPEVLGVGEAAQVEFEIRNLVSDLRPGQAQVYLQYTGVPGHDDGFCTLEVTKRAPEPGILRFWLDTAGVAAGAPVALSWRTFAVASVVLSYQRGDDNVMVSSESGEIGVDTTGYVVRPNVTTTFTLFAYDANGTPVGDDRQQTVTVRPPRVLAFTASPAQVAAGEPVTLSWRTSNATGVTISPGTGTSLPAASDGAPPLVVRPTFRTRDYVLVAHAGEAASEPVPVHVAVPPTITEFSLDPPAVETGSSTPVTLTWTVSDLDGRVVVTSLAARPTTPVADYGDFGTSQQTRQVQPPPTGPGGWRLTATNMDDSTATRTAVLYGYTVTRLTVGAEPVAVWMGNDGRLLVANRGDGTVSVVDVARRVVSAPIPVGGHPHGINVAFQPRAGGGSDVRYQVATDRDGTSVFLDAATLQPVVAWPGAPAPLPPWFGWAAGALLQDPTTPAALARRMPDVPDPARRLSYLPDTTGGVLQIVSYAAVARVTRLDVHPACVDVTAGPAPVALTWDFDHADTLTLDPGGRVTGTAATPSVTAPTRFTLTAVAADGTNHAREVAVCTYRRTVLVPRDREPVAVALAPDKALAYVLTRADGAVSVIDVARSTVIATIPDVDAGTHDAHLLTFEHVPGRLVVFSGPTLLVAQPFEAETEIDPTTRRVVYAGVPRSLPVNNTARRVGVTSTGTAFQQDFPINPIQALVPMASSRSIPPGDWPGAAAAFVGDASTLFAVAGGELVAVTFRGAPAMRTRSPG